MPGTRSVLVVDDDPDVRASIAEFLDDEGAEVVVAASAEDALSIIATTRPELVISDVRMPGLSGLELLRLIRERAPEVDVVLMTAFDDMPTIVSAMRAGASDFLTKPLDLADLRAVLSRVFSDQDLRDVGNEVPDDLSTGGDYLIGRDPRMIAIYKLIGQVAANRTTVLVRGESGTGKELIARAIHFNSPNASQPFVPVNCTALPSGLLESELFGHLRGSFTGAVANRRGRFALAGTGTIFLDEMGDTTLEFQAKLLRVLEDRQFFPVGAEHAEHTEARVIAATHRNLEELIEQKLFRADLYYRLRVVEIRIPPLRERPSDIPLLAQHLILRASHRLGRSIAPVLAPEALQELLRRSWPGNVRELDNCLTRAVVLSPGGVIRPELLENSADRPTINGLGTLADVERDHIVRVLVATDGNKARAARMLGISRPRLDRLLWKHDIEST